VALYRCANLEVPWTLALVLWIAAAGVVYAGLFPGWIINFVAKAALSAR